MQTVFQSLFGTHGFDSCLIDVVNRGGDADTTGAICGMIAGALYGLEAIPSGWMDSLDGEIREQCEYQARALPGLLATNNVTSDQLRDAK
jgi:ADP-ribosyl-[dinitrogen reductase] hydrolase